MTSGNDQIHPHAPDFRFELVRHDYSKFWAPKEIPDHCADIIIADPPYNLGFRYPGDSTGDNLPLEKYRELMARSARRMARWLAIGGTLWWLCPVSDMHWVEPMLRTAVGPVLYHIVWHEAFSPYNRFDLTRDFRMWVVVTNTAHPCRPNADAIRVPSARLQMKTPDKRADPRGRLPGTVWSFRRLQGTSTHRVDWHPTQLPPEMLDRIILGWSQPRGVVIDGFCGSCSSGVRAIAHGRAFIGVDKSAETIRRARSRLNRAAADPDAALKNGVQ